MDLKTAGPASGSSIQLCNSWSGCRTLAAGRGNPLKLWNLPWLRTRQAKIAHWFYQRRFIEEAPGVFQSKDCLSRFSHLLAYEPLYFQLSREVCHVTRGTVERDEDFIEHKPLMPAAEPQHILVENASQSPRSHKEKYQLNAQSKESSFRNLKDHNHGNRSQKENPYPPPCVYPSPQRRRNPLMPTNSRPNGQSHHCRDVSSERGDFEVFVLVIVSWEVRPLSSARTCKLAGGL